MKDPERRKNTIGATITAIVIGFLVVSGLVAVGFFVFMAIAMASFGSNK